MRRLLPLLLACSVANADVVLKYGTNLPRKEDSMGQTKAIFISHQDKLYEAFVYQLECGGWFDNAEGRRSSVLVGPSLGVHVDSSSGVFAQALVGPALITAPDSMLGGPFQFNNDFSVGFKDRSYKATIGIAYKHVSSAGIETPNIGRDLIMFRVSIPW